MRARAVLLVLFWVFALPSTSGVSGSCPSYEVYPGICLDPGHGGPGACKWDPPCSNGDGFGCRGPVPDSCPSCFLTEAWVNHEIVDIAKDLLEEYTYVRLTKNDGITELVSPAERAMRANDDENVDIFLSVHHEGNTNATDTRVFYYDHPNIPNPETSQWRYKLAEAVARGIDNHFHYDKQVFARSDLTVLNQTWMPAALSEGSCIGLVSEATLMASSLEQRTDEALGIMEGFFSYDAATSPYDFRCEKVQVAKVWYALLSWEAVEGADGYLLYVDGFLPPGAMSSYSLERWKTGRSLRFGEAQTVDSLTMSSWGSSNLIPIRSNTASLMILSLTL